MLTWRGWLVAAEAGGGIVAGVDDVGGDGVGAAVGDGGPDRDLVHVFVVEELQESYVSLGPGSGSVAVMALSARSAVATASAGGVPAGFQ